MSAKEFMALDLTKLEWHGPICGLCRKEIKRGEEQTPIRNGVAHADCYYEELGNEIEQHPLGNAGRRR